MLEGAEVFFESSDQQGCPCTKKTMQFSTKNNAPRISDAFEICSVSSKPDGSFFVASCSRLLRTIDLPHIIACKNSGELLLFRLPADPPQRSQPSLHTGERWLCTHIQKKIREPRNVELDVKHNRHKRDYPRSNVIRSKSVSSRVIGDGQLPVIK